MRGQHFYVFIEHVFCAQHHAGHCVWVEDKSTEDCKTLSSTCLWCVCREDETDSCETLTTTGEDVIKSQ